jgi:hypothetical protein
MKPVSFETLLNTIRNLLRKQEEEEKYSEEKVAEFIETRFRKLERDAGIGLAHFFWKTLFGWRPNRDRSTCRNRL